MNWKIEDPITGERLQSIAEATVLTRSIQEFHRSLPEAGIRNVVLFPGTHRSLEPDRGAIAALRGCRIIFVYTHLLPSFVREVLPRLDHRFVLISHNSDDCVDTRFLPALENPRITHWFAQNAKVEHPKLTPIPIGVANAQWPHGRIDELVAVSAALRPPAAERIYCNFNVRTNPERIAITERLAATGIALTVLAKPFRDYLADMVRCRWCMSPPGNGADCHRTWEALYLGVVPIVFGTPWNAALHAGLPVLRVAGADDLTLDSITAGQARLDGRPLSPDRLTMGYWRRLISEKARTAASST